MSEVFLKNSKPLDKISGIIERVIYHNSENGWTVLKVNPFRSSSNSKKLITVVTSRAKAFSGATMDFFGSWQMNSRYGEQFVATKSLEKKPATLSAIEKYLGSGLIKGVGPITARKIVSFFKEKTLDVFEEKIDQLTQVHGIGLKKLEFIQKSWREHRSIRDVMLFLQEHEMSTLFAVKIFKTYGEKSIQYVSEDPYRLARDIFGIGFLSSDRMALKLGIKKDSPQRIQEGIQHCLFLSQNQGHCYLLEDQIIKSTQELLGPEILPQMILMALESLVQKKQIMVRKILNADLNPTSCYYSKALYNYEIKIVKMIRRKLENTIELNFSQVQNEIQNICHQLDLNLSIEQKEALLNALRSPFSLLTGGPGCGKTTLTKILVNYLLKKRKKVLLTAPTGRAAQRMSEIIQGVPSKTIHRTLKWLPREGGFQKNEENPLEGDFLIADECSMLDISLSEALLSAVPHSMQVLLIGDPDQLPSIGAGNVLKDLIDSKIIPCFKLKKIFRQSKKSKVIQFAHEINHGEIPKIPSPIAKSKSFIENSDCFFLESDEMTMEQKNFTKKVKKYFEEKNMENHQIKSEKPSSPLIDPLNPPSDHPSLDWIPEKFKHVHLKKLSEAQTEVEILKILTKSLSPWSTLHHNLLATESISRLYTQSIRKRLGETAEIQILSPQIRGSLGTQNLNHLIQKKINPLTGNKASLQLGGKYFIEGDRVIQTRNNYDLNVFNGDIGRISKIIPHERKIEITFDDNTKPHHPWKEILYQNQDLLDIDLAYAITIHKSQGSEFDAVIIPLSLQHFNMLHRSLIYTALTRAKKLCFFVGSKKAFAISVKRIQNLKRQSMLKELLIH